MQENGIRLLKISTVIILMGGWFVAGVYWSLYKEYSNLSSGLMHDLQIASAKIEMCVELGGQPKRFDLMWTDKEGRSNRLEFLIDNKPKNVCLRCHTEV